MMKLRYKEQLTKIRNTISPERRHKAALLALEMISSLTAKHKRVLSFASFGSEIDTSQINKLLAQENKLLLPRVTNQSLEIFQVTNLASHLQESPFGIPEPIPDMCKRVAPSDITIAFIPGLGFDSKNHRLGYGRGYYDRFLASEPSIHETYGFGFTEQLVMEGLPTQPHDIRLGGVFLF